MNHKKVKLFLLILVLFLASFVRLWKLDTVPESLFGDELDVGYHAYSISKTGRDYSGNFMPLHFHSLAEWRTPLYLYSAVPTVALFGISAYGVRLPAAIYGILGVWGIYLFMIQFSKRLQLRDIKGKFVEEYLPLTAAFFLAISPWHIHYSRAAFEVTQLLAFILFGLYFFFRAIEEKRFLWLSVTLLILTPLIYSTAKLFTPFLMAFLFFAYIKEILSLPKKQILLALFAGIIISTPVIYGTFFSGGTQRFSYISVFTDPTIEPEVGTARTLDAQVRGQKVVGLTPSFMDRFYHNKVVFWSERISTNLLTPFSNDFLFISGDPNDRHSVKGMGVQYKLDFILLIIGIVYFFTKANRRSKALVAFWFVSGVFPSAITRDGGNHATRLILILPPIIILIAYGFISGLRALPKRFSRVVLVIYFILLGISFIYYQHTYWIHYSIDTERLWHSGHKEAMQYVKENSDKYDKVILSMANEPIWIFFAAYTEYQPSEWHEGYPFKQKTLPGFGEISYIDKYYFGQLQAQEGSVYDLPRFIDSKTLYLSVAKEIGANLILEPERTPPGLKLLKAVPFPSGEPAFYLFTASL